MFRAITLAATFWLMLILLPAAVQAQSEQQGIFVLKEAKEIQYKARSREDSEKALRKYEEALRIFERAGSQKGRYVVLNNIAWVYRDCAQYRKALEYYDKALEIVRKVGDIQSQAGILNNIASVYSYWVQYPKALEYCEKSLAITRRIGDTRQEGVALNNIGLVYKSWGQYPQAMEYCEKSLAIRQKLGDVKGESVALNNIGLVYKSWGQYPQAMEYYEKGLAIQKKIGVPSDGTEDSIGNMYVSTGDMQRAELLLKKPDRGASLGRLALSKSDFNEARTQYERVRSSAYHCSRRVFGSAPV